MQATVRRAGQWTIILAVTIGLVPAGAIAKDAAPAQKKTAAASRVAAAPSLEDKAIDVLKASSRRLAEARAMQFTAVVSYESPSRLGPPLVYTTKSEVVMQRPDKLRVLMLGDGPASEFYYDGKMMMAFSPAEDVVAISDAPPTIDAALAALHESAATYFPFADVIVADSYGDLAPDLTLAFYMGQSNVVGGTTTDMIAYATDHVFVQAWIGAEDRLPRRLRALYLDDPARLRHDMLLTAWEIEPKVPAGAFTSAKAGAAKRIEFARPDPQLPPASGAPAKRKPTKAKTVAQ